MSATTIYRGRSSSPTARGRLLLRDVAVADAAANLLATVSVLSSARPGWSNIWSNELRRTQPDRAGRRRPRCAAHLHQQAHDGMHPDLVERPHNPKVAGSNPAPATT